MFEDMDDSSDIGFPFRYAQPQIEKIAQSPLNQFYILRVATRNIKIELAQRRTALPLRFGGMDGALITMQLQSKTNLIPIKISFLDWPLYNSINY